MISWHAQDEAAYLDSRASSMASSLDLEAGGPRRLSAEAPRRLSGDAAAALTPAQQQNPFAAAAARLQQQQQPKQDAGGDPGGLVSIPEDSGNVSGDLGRPAARVGHLNLVSLHPL